MSFVFYRSGAELTGILVKPLVLGGVHSPGNCLPSSISYNQWPLSSFESRDHEIKLGNVGAVVEAVNHITAFTNICSGGSSRFQHERLAPQSWMGFTPMDLLLWITDNFLNKRSRSRDLRETANCGHIKNDMKFSSVAAVQFSLPCLRFHPTNYHCLRDSQTRSDDKRKWCERREISA